MAGSEQEARARVGDYFAPVSWPDAVTGMDIARCKDGVIVELYTFVDGVGRP